MKLKTRTNQPVYYKLPVSSNMEQLSDGLLNSLKVGDVVQKKTGNQKHCYIVSYKEEKKGICLTYVDGSGYMETISYDYTGGHWVYNSKDVTQAQNKIENLVHVSAEIWDYDEYFVGLRLVIEKPENVFITKFTFNAEIVVKGNMGTDMHYCINYLCYYDVASNKYMFTDNNEDTLSGVASNSSVTNTIILFAGNIDDPVEHFQVGEEITEVYADGYFGGIYNACFTTDENQEEITFEEIS